MTEYVQSTQRNGFDASELESLAKAHAGRSQRRRLVWQDRSSQAYTRSFISQKGLRPTYGREVRPTSPKCIWSPKGLSREIYSQRESATAVNSAFDCKDPKPLVVIYYPEIIRPLCPNHAHDECQQKQYTGCIKTAGKPSDKFDGGGSGADHLRL
jgi:hypothetical protein